MRQDGLNPATAAESVAESNHMDLPSCQLHLQATSRSYMLATSTGWVTPGTTESVADMLGRYLSDELDNDTSCLTFWRKHLKYGRLAISALRALSVPALSAPVEPVFSYGGIFMRPHRAGMSETTLSALVFLKCNSCKLTKLLWITLLTAVFQNYQCCGNSIIILDLLLVSSHSLNGELFQLVVTLILICLYWNPDWDLTAVDWDLHSDSSHVGLVTGLLTTPKQTIFYCLNRLSYLRNGLRQRLQIWYRGWP